VIILKSKSRIRNELFISEPKGTVITSGVLGEGLSQIFWDYGTN
jgi:hypothetical protein